MVWAGVRFWVWVRVRVWVWFGLESRILAWSTLVDRGTESSYKLPCPGIRPLERETHAPLQFGSRRQQLDRQIFTSEVFLLSSATELLFFSLRFVFSSYFFTYFFFFASLAGQPQSLVVFSQPQAHSHFKLKIRKKHSGAHAQQRQTCRRNGQRWRTGAKGCCCSCFCCSSCCREKRKKKFLLPPLAAVSLGSRRNKKEIKAKN